MLFYFLKETVTNYLTTGCDWWIKKQDCSGFSESRCILSTVWLKSIAHLSHRIRCIDRLKTDLSQN